ncbi:MAG: response regulator transcription factor [Proteobacteria bacterium]|nr:response regulator transcription factor [Pseudomonadota bacterium]
MNILIADDHELIREGIRQSLQNLIPDGVIFEAEDEQQVQTVLQSERIDVLLLDLVLPNGKSFKLLENAIVEYPEMKVAMLTASEDVNDVRKCMGFGASAFITKTSGKTNLVNALRLVIEGGVFISPDLIDKINESQADGGSNDDNKKIDSLTNRQKEVLELVCKGSSNKEIANLLGLSDNTVKIHVTAILKSLDVSNRTQAVLFANKTGLFE